MPTTNFVDKTTVVEADWLNDVDAHVFDQSTGLHTAANIANVPAGAVVATTVQAAINELDGDLTAHITDATDAHAGSAITNTPAGGISATTIQAAINELDTEKINNSLLTTRGDIIVRGASAPQRLGIGTVGQTILSDGTDPVWVPQAFSFKNKIIGGDFTTNPWQRGTSFTSATIGYHADMWALGGSSAAVVDILKTADAPTPVETGGHYTQHCYHVDVTTADASIAAGDYMCPYSCIEGLNAASFGFGQAGTRYITLSFWVKAAKTGIHCVSLGNNANDRSYVKEYSISVANTWEKKILTFPVDTSGTWLYTTGVGLRVRFALAAGSTYQTTADTWVAGQYFATSNQVNELDNTSNNFKLALVQLEAGSVATPFEARDVGTELALCQRYFAAFSGQNTTSTIRCGGAWTSATNFRCYLYLPVRMRTAPASIVVSTVSLITATDDVAVSQALTSATLSEQSNEAIIINCGVASGGTAGRAGRIFFNSTSGYIQVPAEL